MLVDYVRVYTNRTSRDEFDFKGFARF
jgi:hypothetical protein